MKTIQKTFYVCEECGKEFEKKFDCQYHERQYHKCPNCEHCWYLYGSEQQCDLEYKGCHFKQKEIKNK